MRYVTFRSDNVLWHSPGAAMTNDMRAPTFETSSCLSEHAWQSANYTSGLLSCFSVQKGRFCFVVNWAANFYQRALQVVTGKRFNIKSFVESVFDLVQRLLLILLTCKR